MNDKINLILNDLKTHNLENTLSVYDVKQWVFEYLDSYNDEVNKFPEIKNEPHWDLLVADYEKDKLATFIFVFFERDFFRIFGGVGGCTDLVEFGENGFPDNPLEVEAKLEDIIQEKSRVFEGEIKEIQAWK